VGLQEAHERAVAVGACEPGGDAESIVLIGSATLRSEAAAPQRRIDLGDCRAARGDVPAVESEGIDEIFKSAPWLEKPVTATALESALRSLIAS